MSVTELDALAARLAGEDSEVFLGQLFWYSFSDVRVPHDEMIGFLAIAGITKNLPFVPDDVDVFKRVCKDVSRRAKAPTTTPNVFIRYQFHEFRDKTSVTKRVVRETLDNKDRVLDFTECADIVYDRETHIVTSSPVNHQPIDPEIYKLVDDVTAGYEEWRNCLGTYAVRQWVRGFILHLGATQVRPGGGVYFLRLVNSPELEALERLAEQIRDHGYGTVEFHSLPLVDDRKQRLMVQHAFESETSDMIDEIQREMSALLEADKPVPVEKYSDYVARFQSTKTRIREYEELLQDNLRDTGSRLRIFQQSLMALHGKVPHT